MEQPSIIVNYQDAFYVLIFLAKGRFLLRKKHNNRHKNREIDFEKINLEMTFLMVSHGFSSMIE